MEKGKMSGLRYAFTSFASMCACHPKKFHFESEAASSVCVLYNAIMLSRTPTPTLPFSVQSSRVRVGSFSVVMLVSVRKGW